MNISFCDWIELYVQMQTLLETGDVTIEHSKIRNLLNYRICRSHQNYFFSSVFNISRNLFRTFSFLVNWKLLSSLPLLREMNWSILQKLQRLPSDRKQGKWLSTYWPVWQALCTENVLGPIKISCGVGYVVMNFEKLVQKLVLYCQPVTNTFKQFEEAPIAYTTTKA